VSVPFVLHVASSSPRANSIKKYLMVAPYACPFENRLLSSIATVDHQRVTGYQGRGIRAEPNHRTGDSFRRAHVFHGMEI